MRMYTFRPPQEILEPHLWTSTQDFTHVNTGKFVRNAVLDGMTYGGNDLVPAFLKTCDAIHPLVGTQSIDGTAQSCYGALLDSVNSAATIGAIKSVVQPWNTTTVWAPGGTGMDAWLAVKLPEATLVERYIVASMVSTCPLSWKLQGSLDGSTWADLHVVENTGVWGATREEKTFTVPEASRGTYLWYRLYITASNATTMSISTLRLLRAQSVCDRGQLRLDASAAAPLSLSFMDGFASDGVTPVDYTESLSSAIVQALGDYDSEGLPISGQGAVPVDIFAKRDSAGNTTITVEAALSTETEYLGGGMKAQTDRGFYCNSPSGYKIWGGARYLNGGAPYSNLSRVDGSSFYVSNVEIAYNAGIYAIEENGSTTFIAYHDGGQYYAKHSVNRKVKGLTLRDSQGGTSGGSYYSAAIYGNSSPFTYRVSSGKLYQKAPADTAWSPVQKIKIASAVWNGTDLYQLQPRTSMLMQWMTQGDNVTYLEP